MNRQNTLCWNFGHSFGD